MSDREIAELEDAARMLARSARQLTRDAERKRRQAEQARKAARPRRIARDYLDMIDRGLAPEDALAAAAAAHGVPLETVRHFARRLLRSDASARRWLRNREIFRLAARGWSNADIARQVGLRNPASVSRIVQAELQKTTGGGIV